MGTAKQLYRRRMWVVNPALQYRFTGILLAAITVMWAGAIASVYLAIWITLRTFDAPSNPSAVTQLGLVGIIVTTELLLIAPIVVWVGIRWTHRVAGPLVRIKWALEQMAQGRFDLHLTLRKGDALVDVADAINRLAVSIHTRRS